MEFVRGRDLRRVIREEGRLPPDRLIGLMGAIADPVDAAHRSGILHRDLKPENILLPVEGVAAKVVDFGIAKAVATETTDGEETLTAAGQPIGTPAYMAPEQLAGAALSPRTDVFALGVIACELLTGELPFGRGTLLEIATRQIRGLATLPALPGDVPPAITDAVLAALSTDAAGRPATASEFAARLLRGATV